MTIAAKAVIATFYGSSESSDGDGELAMDSCWTAMAARERGTPHDFTNSARSH
jgi:hypothetical protein